MGMFRALRHRDFRLLWTSALFIQLGHWFVTIGFQWVLPHTTDEDAVLLGLLYFCTFAPYLIFSLPAGALADNRDRRRILLAAQTMALLLAVTSTVLAATDTLPPPIVLALGFVSGCVVTLVSPANQALTANTVPPGDLASAIPLQSTALNLARIAGPTLAGPLLLGVGATGAFAVYSVVCLCVLGLVSQIRVTRRIPPRRVERVLTRVRAGIAHARERRPTPAALLTVAVTSVFGCGYQSQLAMIGARISDDGDSAFLVLLVCGGAGSLAGVLWVARSRVLPRLGSATGGLVGLGIAVALMGSVRSYPAMMALTLVAGALTFSVMTIANTLIQHLIDDAQRGRVMSLYFLCWGGLLPFGGLGIGGTIGWLGSPVAFALFGGVAAVGGVLIGWWQHRDDADQLPARG